MVGGRLPCVDPSSMMPASWVGLLDGTVEHAAFGEPEPLARLRQQHFEQAQDLLHVVQQDGALTARIRRRQVERIDTVGR